MARNIVPRAHHNGNLGRADKHWLTAYVNTIIAQTIHGNLVGSITGNAPTADNAAVAQYVANDSASMRFHWSGQSVQPSWLWGGSDPNNMYVYNPSNFSVNYANSAGWAGGAGNVEGYTAAQLIAAAQSGITSGNTVAVLTGTIIGSGTGNYTFTIPLPSGFTESQCKFLGFILHQKSSNISMLTNLNVVIPFVTRTRIMYTSPDDPAILFYIVIGVK